MVSPVNAQVACCHCHMQTSFWLPALPLNPRQQAHISVMHFIPLLQKPGQDVQGSQHLVWQARKQTPSRTGND